LNSLGWEVTGYIIISGTSTVIQNFDPVSVMAAQVFLMRAALSRALGMIWRAENKDSEAPISLRGTPKEKSGKY
jgi:hypothetical protein